MNAQTGLGLTQTQTQGLGQGLVEGLAGRDLANFPDFPPIHRRFLTCPRGFDCAFLNSCPFRILNCPEGYFCGRYQGFEHQGDIDFRYAQLKELYDGADVSYDTAWMYIDRQRAIQSKCVQGFYCPSASQMIQCPEGSWCPESSSDPISCDDLSICPEGSNYAIELADTIMGALFAFITVLVSLMIRRRQQKADKRSRQQILQVVPSSSVTLSATPLSNGTGAGIEIDFTDLTVSVTYRDGHEHQILPSISGHIPANMFTLMLGSTGCGKTTWLRALRSGGQGTSKGDVYYWRKRPTKAISPSEAPSDATADAEAEKEEPIQLLGHLLQHHSTQRIATSELPNCVGYVPQEDMLDRSLTVRELLTYSATARCPDSSSADVQAIVTRTLADLDILHIADSIIGGGENSAANISGGQLKRVNIACELVAMVARPAVLLCDEVTAGLDASVALDLVKTLQRLTVQGVTVVCVLQQPRPEIFEAMDHLLLMGCDGSIVFEGSPADASAHLQAMGHKPYCPETSTADFCIDVLNDIRERESERQSSVGGGIGGDGASVFSYTSLNARGTRRSIQEETAEAWRPGYWLRRAAAACRFSRRDLRVLTQRIALNARRLMVVRMRNLPQIAVNLAIHVVMAVALSSGFSIILTDSFLSVFNPTSLVPLQPFYPSVLASTASYNVNDLAFNQLLFFMSGALGSAASLAAVPVFAGQAALAAREQSSGLSAAAFATGRIVGDIYFLLLNGFAFAAVWCFFGMPGGYNRWLSVILATSFAASGIGYLTAVLVPLKDASVFAVIVTFICCVFSGTEPSLRQVERYSVVSLPWYLSFGTWTAEATYATWASYLIDHGADSATIDSGADKYGYDPTHGLARSIGALVAIGLGLRVLAVWALHVLAK